MRLFLVLAVSASLLLGCGDGSRSPTVTFTVETLAGSPPFDPATRSLEYSLACRESENVDESQSDGELAFVGAAPVNGAPGYVWKATTDAPPGPYSVLFQLRDSNWEVICTECCEEFITSADAPTDVNVFMGCELVPY